MEFPKVVHCKQNPFDILIDRSTKWGNPFIIGTDGTRREVIKKYKNWILKQPDLLKDLHQLKGKILGCWCKPLPCHGDVLFELANREDINNLFGE